MFSAIHEFYPMESIPDLVTIWRRCCELLNPIQDCLEFTSEEFRRELCLSLNLTYEPKVDINTRLTRQEKADISHSVNYKAVQAGFNIVSTSYIAIRSGTDIYGYADAKHISMLMSSNPTIHMKTFAFRTKYQKTRSIFLNGISPGNMIPGCTGSEYAIWCFALSLLQLVQPSDRDTLDM